MKFLYTDNIIKDYVISLSKSNNICFTVVYNQIIQLIYYQEKVFHVVISKAVIFFISKCNVLIFQTYFFLRVTNYQFAVYKTNSLNHCFIHQ